MRNFLLANASEKDRRSGTLTKAPVLLHRPGKNERLSLDDIS